tara:strand:- start:1243 stop:1425 length:183 start_codon:yes stop_codon:yes gene_type:complete
LLVIFSDGECAASFVSPHLAGLLLSPIKDLIEAGQNGMKNKKLTHANGQRKNTFIASYTQ